MGLASFGFHVASRMENVAIGENIEIPAVSLPPDKVLSMPSRASEDRQAAPATKPLLPNPPDCEPPAPFRWPRVFPGL